MPFLNFYVTMHTIFWLKNLKEIDHLEKQGVDGKELILGKKFRGYGLDASGSDMDQWRALVNTVMNIWVT
jgi:hypothetical protein